MSGRTEERVLAVPTAVLHEAGVFQGFTPRADHYLPRLLDPRHFRWLPPCRDTWLVAESALDAEATRPFDGRTFWFRLARHQPWPYWPPLTSG